MVDKRAGNSASNLIDVGRVAGVFGIRGWLKVHSYTEPPENLFGYSPWWLKTPHGVRPVAVADSRPHGKGHIAQLEGVDDRDEAALYNGVTIAVDKRQLPALAEDDYYWHQLQGLEVVSHWQGRQHPLGRVARLLETGANDVLVVCDENGRERLVPFVPDEYVRQVDLTAGRIEVEWDPEF